VRETGACTEDHYNRGVKTHWPNNNWNEYSQSRKVLVQSLAKLTSPQTQLQHNSIQLVSNVLAPHFTFPVKRYQPRHVIHCGTRRYFSVTARAHKRVASAGQAIAPLTVAALGVHLSYLRAVRRLRTQAMPKQASLMNLRVALAATYSLFTTNTLYHQCRYPW
jgi:hypothetical protein